MDIDSKNIAEFSGVAANIGAWAWKEFGKDITLKVGGLVWKKFRFDSAKIKYQAELKGIHSTMRVLHKLDTISLESQYVELFVLEKPEAHRKHNVDYLENNFEDSVGFYHRSARTEALIVVNEKDRLFVLGKPGAGKTTFLKYLTSLAANEKRIDKIPIFISLNSLAYSQKSLFEYIVDQFKICNFPDAGKFIEAIFEKGKALLLFDGLDEIDVNSSRRVQIIHEIENLIRQYQANKFIITCRNGANEYQFEGFTYVEIADFTDLQVSAFVEKWFVDNPEKSKKFQDELGKDEHQNLRELTHNPLLLGMLCLVFEETLNFPSQRGRIYRDAIHALMDKWDKQRAVQRRKISGFPQGFEIKLLAFLAYDYLVENKIFFEEYNLLKKVEIKIPAPDKIDGLESKNIIDMIEVQHGLLLQRSRGIYSFSHLTFQEYFTAQYVVDNLDLDNNPFDNLFKYLNNSRWREVFPLVASLTSRHDIFLEKLVEIIQKPIKKNKSLSNLMKNIDDLSSEFQKPIDIITARMRIIALIISVNKIFNIIRKSAKARSSMLAKKLLQIINLDPSDVSLEKASEISRIILMGFVNKQGKDKINNLLRLSIKKQQQSDDDFDIQQISSDYIEGKRITLRDELKKSEKIASEKVIDDIKEKLDKTLFIGVALRIVLGFTPRFIEDFIDNVSNVNLPQTFAEEESWRDYLMKLIELTVPILKRNEILLKEEYLVDLEYFLQNNILLLDCIRHAEAKNYENYVFLIKPYKA